MLRMLNSKEVALVSGGMETDDSFNDGGGGYDSDGGFDDGGSYGGGGGGGDYSDDVVVTASDNAASNNDMQVDYQTDQQGDIVVVGERNMPQGWSDSSWAQIGCKVAGNMAGQNDFESDLICRVDWSGDNPADPRNANRLGEIMKNHSDELFQAYDKIQRGMDQQFQMR